MCCTGLVAPLLEPVSPALAGGFFTTAPPGKPREGFLKATFGVRVAAQGSSDSLVVRHQGGVLGILSISLVPASLGSTAYYGQHVVTILHLDGLS